MKYVPIESRAQGHFEVLLWSRTAAIASLVLLVVLVLVPCAVLFSAIGSGSGPQHLRLFQIPVACWAVWALISLWAALDSSKLLHTLGITADPLGSCGFWGVLLGVLNVGASFLVALLRSSR